MKIKKRTWYLMFGLRKTHRFEVVVCDLKKNVIVYEGKFKDESTARMRLRQELHRLGSEKRLGFGFVTHNGIQIVRLDVFMKVDVYYFVA